MVYKTRNKSLGFEYWINAHDWYLLRWREKADYCSLFKDGMIAKYIYFLSKLNFTHLDFTSFWEPSMTYIKEFLYSKTPLSLLKGVLLMRKGVIKWEKVDINIKAVKIKCIKEFSPWSNQLCNLYSWHHYRLKLFSLCSLCQSHDFLYHLFVSR